MTIKEDFIKSFGKEIFNKIVSMAGHHSIESGYLSTASPEELKKFEELDEESKLVFGLLEMIDYRCYDYDRECNVGLTEDDIKNFLLKHKNKILKMKIPPPSLMGLIVGDFNFLIEDENKK